MCAELKTWMKENGKTQAWLVKQCGVSQAAVSKWIRGRVGHRKVSLVSALTGIPLVKLRPDIFGRSQ